MLMGVVQPVEDVLFAWSDLSGLSGLLRKGSKSSKAELSYSKLWKSCRGTKQYQVCTLGNQQQ